MLFAVSVALAACANPGAKQDAAAPTTSIAAMPNLGSQPPLAASTSNEESMVTCKEDKAWSHGTAYIYLHSLDPIAGTAKITGKSPQGYPWDSSRFKFNAKEMTLNFDRPPRQYRLVVGERNLKGIFNNSENAKELNLKVDYQCDGPIERIIKRQ